MAQPHIYTFHFLLKYSMCDYSDHTRLNKLFKYVM